MKVKAKDTMHVSSVKADNILPGEEFEVSDDIGRQLVERGLVTEAKSRKADKSEADEVVPEKAPISKVAAPKKRVK